MEALSLEHQGHQRAVHGVALDHRFTGLDERVAGSVERAEQSRLPLGLGDAEVPEESIDDVLPRSLPESRSPQRERSNVDVVIGGAHDLLPPQLMTPDDGGAYADTRVAGGRPSSLDHSIKPC